MATSRCLLILAFLSSLSLAAGCGKASLSDADAGSAQRALALLTQARFLAPSGWQWDTLTNADGARLRYGWAVPLKSVRGLIVFAPSFQAPAEQYFETFHSLLDAGFAIWVLDRRGQGASDRWPQMGQRAYLDGGWREVRDLRQFSSVAHAHHENLPMFLVGESLGGLIGLRLLHDDPDLFAAAVFSSPAIDFKTGNINRSLARWATFLLCGLGFERSYAFNQHDWKFDSTAGGASDPAKNDPDRALAAQALLLREPSLREGGATNGFVRTLFEEADLEQSSQWASGIRIPVLFGVTMDDQVARPEIMLSTCHTMPRCSVARFDGAPHSLFSDADPVHSRWLASLLTFLDKHGARSADPPLQRCAGRIAPQNTNRIDFPHA